MAPSLSNQQPGFRPLPIRAGRRGGASGQARLRRSPAAVRKAIFAKALGPSQWRKGGGLVSCGTLALRPESCECASPGCLVFLGRRFVPESEYHACLEEPLRLSASPPLLPDPPGPGVPRAPHGLAAWPLSGVWELC